MDNHEISSHDVVIDSTGIPFRVRVYPVLGPSASTVVWFHGGAFMLGSIDMPEADAVSKELAKLGIAVVSVDYVLAPLLAAELAGSLPIGPEDVLPVQRAVPGSSASSRRARFPAASLQAVAAFEWAVAHASEFGGDPRRVAMGGASAGANIATGATIRLRDGNGAQPTALLLAYPGLHAEPPAPSDELEALMSSVPESLRFPPEQVRALSVNYVGNEEALSDARAFPAGHFLRGLPPIVIVTAERDRLKASAQAFAAEQIAVDGDVSFAVEAGALHGYLNELGNVSALSTVRRFAAALAIDPR